MDSVNAGLCKLVVFPGKQAALEDAMAEEYAKAQPDGADEETSYESESEPEEVHPSTKRRPARKMV